MSVTPDKASPIPPVLLVGQGRMGGAMVSGWRERGLSRSVAVDPVAVPSLCSGDVISIRDLDQLPADFTPAAVVLAIKPQNAATTLPAYARFAGQAVFLSIMAGQTLSGMRALLGDGAAVVRAMPNAPAAIRQGVSVAAAGPGVTEAQRTLADLLLSAVGEVAWVEDEAQIDAVTAVSGSGPAYVFLLAELLEQAAIEQGLAPDLARRLARKTVSGSGALLAASDAAAADLRRGVTSPKGTTEAALAVLMAETAWPALVSRAVASATERSRELAR